MIASVSPAPPSDRLHGLDALRGFALLLGVVLHALMAYMPGAQYFWLVSDTSSTLAANLGFYWIHLFRMTTFFLLAGYFGRLLFERFGALGFARDRLRRIVVPLIAGWPIVMFAITIPLIWLAWIKGGGSLPQEPAPGPKFTPDDFPLAHLWFLYLLSGFYAAALFVRTLLRYFDPRGRGGRLVDGVLRIAMGPWAALLLGLPVAFALFQHPGWYAWFGIPTPDRSLVPNLPAVVGFGFAFTVGWCLQRQRELLERVVRHRYMHLALALAATTGCLVLIGERSPAAPSPQDLRTAVYAFGYGVAGWAWSLALIGLALKHASGYSAARRYLADASYWVYLVHLPLILLLQVAASQLAWPWWIELLLLLSVAFGLMLGSYQLFVRSSWIGAWLNGRRAARPAPRSGAIAAAV